MQEFDVCIVGSGAAGGTMAKELCEGGAKVILLEAGAEVRPSQFLSHNWPYELPYRGLRGEKEAPFYPKDISTVRYEGSHQVQVDRVRVLGGRTLHWNALCLRYAARDFREWSLEGFGEDWPLTYEEIEPYYDRAEQIMGVCGHDDHLEILPAGKHYMPAIPWRCSEHIMNRATKKMGIPMISARKALNTQPYDGRPPCHYCGHCMTGCMVSAIFTSPDSMLPKARATGNFTLRQNAIAREILVDREGRARAVSFIDRQTRREEQVRAKIIVVCCATVESARLLLNSRSPQHPAGVGNSNGVVGRYLHGHMGGTISVYLEELEGLKPFNQDGATDSVYIPRYNQLFGQRGYAGGWGIQVNNLYPSQYMFPYQAGRIPGYGAQFKGRVRRMQPSFLFFDSFGRLVASPENYVGVDRAQVDDYAIPIPVVRFTFGKNDNALAQAMEQGMREIGSHLKGTVYGDFGGVMGFYSHEVGTIRMGKNPKTSALNGFCQSHDVKNLFVTDGSCFTSASEKNPTLTIIALSIRAADYIKKQRKIGEL